MTQELRLIFFKHHLLKRVSFLLLNCLSAFDKNQLTLYMSVLDWKLCYVPPISVFLLRPAPCCLMTVSQEGLRSGHVSLPLLFLSFKYIKTDRQNKFEKKLQVQKRDKKKSNTYIIGDAEKETRTVQSHVQLHIQENFPEIRKKFETIYSEGSCEPEKTDHYDQYQDVVQ